MNNKEFEARRRLAFFEASLKPWDNTCRDRFNAMRWSVDDCIKNMYEIPYNKGELLALKAYEQTVDFHGCMLECCDMPADLLTIEEFLDCLLEVGVYKLAITDKNHNLIHILHLLKEFNWVYEKLDEVRHENEELSKRFAEAIVVRYAGFDSKEEEDE